jgi:CRP/FNR family cyclic AMP-dependent transcriptional regulator
MAMLLDEQVRLLSMVNVLEPLSREELKDLSQRAPDTHLQEGEDFPNPQQEGERLYMLKTGQAQIYEMTPEGGETTLSVVEAGYIFGEMVLTGQSFSGMYVRALEPSVVCSLKRADLERIILSHPEVGLQLARHLSERVRELEIRLAEIASKDVLARLASLILRLVDRDGIVTREGVMVATRYTHERFGTMIGAKRVAVSRAFNLLRQTGAVETSRRQILIKDTEALKRIASV